MKVLFVGDVVGKPGRRILKEALPHLKKQLRFDLVLANGENAAGGNGITAAVAEELFAAGVELLTMGNHVWDQKEAEEFLDREPRIIRPANYPPGAPGRAIAMLNVAGASLAVLNLSGRVFLPNLDCPFRAADRLLEEIAKKCCLILVDFHAEATSEKVAFGWYLDGRVSAVVGTHTHVQTSDARILPGGTAYISDVGMTGPRDSVLGVKKEAVLQKFLSQMPVRFEVASGVTQLNAVLLDLDEATGKARGITVIAETMG